MKPPEAISRRRRLGFRRGAGRGRARGTARGGVRGRKPAPHRRPRRRRRRVRGRIPIRSSFRRRSRGRVFTVTVTTPPPLPGSTRGRLLRDAGHARRPRRSRRGSQTRGRRRVAQPRPGQASRLATRRGGDRGRVGFIVAPPPPPRAPGGAPALRTPPPPQPGDPDACEYPRGPPRFPVSPRPASP